MTNSFGTVKIPPCYLLKLPTELQLEIYELVVIEDQPLLINCPCESSYYGGYKESREAEESWKNGETRPAQQPALAQTCRFIRQTVLPIFYKENVFRASYCERQIQNTDISINLDEPIQWLRMIGEENREMLRHFYFYDRNPSQDARTQIPLQQLKDCEIFTEMGGKMETLSSGYRCAHLVTFGEQERKPGEIPIASVPYVPRMRMKGER
jgi:hypothetical protein